MEDAEKLSIYYTVDYWGEPSLTIGLRKGITWLEFIRVFSGVEDYGFAFEDIRKVGGSITIRLEALEFKGSDIRIRVEISDTCKKVKTGERVQEEFEYICN